MKLPSYIEICANCGLEGRDGERKTMTCFPAVDSKHDYIKYVNGGAWAQRCQESEQREVNLQLANDVLHKRLRADWAKYAPAVHGYERLDAERIRLQSLCFTHVEARDAALKRVAELEAQLATK